MSLVLLILASGIVWRNRKRRERKAEEAGMNSFQGRLKGGWSLSVWGRVFCLLFRGYPFFGGRNVIWAGGEQFLHCRVVVHSSECPLSEVPL